MIRFPLLALVLSLLAGPALALSCLPPDVARSYKEAAAAEAQYVVVHGVLSFNERRLPRVGSNDSPPSTKIRARLVGKALSTSGFDHPFDREITLDVLCFGPWCGGAASNLPYLAFLERGAQGYTMTVTPCGGFEFPEPNAEMLERVQRCNAGGSCKEQYP